jgi:hypothetical protein
VVNTWMRRLLASKSLNWWPFWSKIFQWIWKFVNE